MIIVSAASELYGFFEKIESIDKKERENLKQRFNIIKFPGTNESQSEDSFKFTLKEEEEYMKNIRHRKDGRWEARKQINKQKYFVIAKTQKECLKKYKDLIKNAKQQFAVNKTQYTLKEWWIVWQETYKKPFISKNSFLTIQCSLKLLEKIDNDIVNCQLKNLSTERLQTLYNKIETSRRKELLFLYFNACMNMAKKLSYISKNCLDDIVKDKKIKKIRRAFTYDEQVKIYDELKNRSEYTPFLIYLFCGLRKNELNTKNIESDIMSDNTLKVICEKKRNSEPVYRYIDLTEDTKNLILNNLKSFNHTTAYFSKQFKKILNNLNIEGSLHTLRHTFTTNQLYLGTPDKFIQEWLGHEDIAITKKHYMSIDRTISKVKLLSLYGNYYYIINN